MKATMKWCTSDGKLWQQLCMSIQYVFFHPILQSILSIMTLVLLPTVIPITKHDRLGHLHGLKWPC